MTHHSSKGLSTLCNSLPLAAYEISSLMGYKKVEYLAFSHNEDESDISGWGVFMFNLEVGLLKDIKSEVIWGHSCEHV